MNEAKVLAAAMNSRAAYEKVAPFMDDKDFSPPGQFWWKLIGEWYGKDTASHSVDAAALADIGSARSAGKQRDAVAGFFGDINVLAGSVSASNIAGIALELKRHNVGMELAAAIAGGDQAKQRKLTPLFAELQQATELTGGKKKPVKRRRALPVDQLFTVVGDQNRVPLAPSRLNTRIDGGALPSTHILLFARPEMGKSTFAVNFAVQLAKAGKKVLYISNEDDENKLQQRALARGVGMTVREVTAERQGEAIQLYRDRGLDELLVFEKVEEASIEDLRPPIEEYEPQVLVLDQIRNLRGGGDGLVQMLDQNGQRFRELLGEYQLIGLSIAQAGAYAGTWLTMEDLDSSKTGLPACADLMIGMGANDDMIAHNQRALSICKNKLSSESNAREGLQVEMDLARVSVK